MNGDGANLISEIIKKLTKIPREEHDSLEYTTETSKKRLVLEIIGLCKKFVANKGRNKFD